MAALPESVTIKKEPTDEDKKSTTKLVGSSVSNPVKAEPTDNKNKESSVSQTVKKEPTDEVSRKVKTEATDTKNTFKVAEPSSVSLTVKKEPTDEVSRKVKNEATNDENEREIASEKELDLPLDKLNLGPKKKLIVLCLGGLLVDRVHVRDKARVRGLRPDVVYGKFLVFKRPFCTEFLNFCFERFDVGLWSAARDRNIDKVLDDIAGGMRSKFAFEWPNTAIFPVPYTAHDCNDTFLGPNGEFRKYLDGLVDAKDVPSYVKGHAIGQPAITPSHPNWDYYNKIVRRSGKKEDSVESSSKLADSK